MAPHPGLGGAVMLVFGGLWAGMQNALAGGGSFITFPALLLAGLDPRTANITSTIALFPAQCATGWVGRSGAGGIGRLGLRALAAISLLGGALGAGLLLATPPAFFARLVPWLILFATLVFAWGSFRPRSARVAASPCPGLAAAIQLAISVYGGYFGGGIGFLMLAALTSLGMAVRQAGATKNILAGVMNASAVLIFALASRVAWWDAALVGGAAMLGGVTGGLVLNRVDEKTLRVAVVAIGVVLTAAMFVRR